MNRLEHYREAERLMDVKALEEMSRKVHGVTKGSDMWKSMAARDSIMAVYACAQVHATLACVPGSEEA